MDFRTPIQFPAQDWQIDHNKTGLLLGSCFVENIGRRMTEMKFPVTVNPFGIQFNPASISQALLRLQSGEPYTEDELSRNGDLWFSFDHHGAFNSVEATKTLNTINKSFERGCEAFQNADYLILTLGTSWIYRLGKTGKIVNNCHKLPAKDFVREKMSVAEIVETLRKALGDWLDTGKRLILTVSPVRHLGDGLVENQLSKSTLIVAAHELAGRYPNIIYFPAYEILMDDLRDYRFYQPDMTHPSDTAVQYIWEVFSNSLITPDSRELMEQVEKLNAARHHRPLHTGSAQYIKFRDDMAEKCRALASRYPQLDWRQELDFFSPESGSRK